MFWKEAIVVATFVMILVWMYTKVFVFWNMFQCFDSCLKMFWNCMCLFENSKDVLQIDQVTRSYLPYSKIFPIHFLFLWHCCFTIAFGKQPYLWMLNGTDMGHRMTMIAMLPSILTIFEGPRSSLFRQPFDSVIEGLWSFVLFCQDT